MNEYTEQLGRFLQIMKETARPAMWLKTAEKPGFSKLGGNPFLPEDIDWPYWRGRPLCFLAQLDLGELQAAKTWPELPSEGWLYFFYPGDWWEGNERHPFATSPWATPWGNKPEHAGSTAVLFSLNKPTRLLEPPAEMREPGFFIGDLPASYCERYLTASVVKSFNSADYLVGRHQAEMTDEEYEGLVRPLDEAYTDHNRSQFNRDLKLLHQLGGYPIPWQFEDMALQCQLTSNGVDLRYGQVPDDKIRDLATGAEDWTLLLQLDTDDFEDLPEAGGNVMIWGDYGRLYFWIRKQDLAARDFSRVWTILECT